MLTCHEVWKWNQIDIDKSIQSIQDAMTLRNPSKYWDFLKTLDSIKLALRLLGLSKVDIRVELFRCVYYAMRLIDDVIDGDTVPPLEHKDRKTLVDSILSWNIENIKNSLYKELAQRIQSLSSELWYEQQMNESMLEILESMKFDLNRIMDEDDKTRTQLDLATNFHSMDIDGTIAWTAIIFWVDIESAINGLNDLWEACRIVYNLDDFVDDVKEGLINIWREDLDRFNITAYDLEIVASQNFAPEHMPTSIIAWFEKEVRNYFNRMEVFKAKSIQWLKFEDKRDVILRGFRNLLMNRIILPKTYVDNNEQRIRKIIIKYWLKIQEV